MPLDRQNFEEDGKRFENIFGATDELCLVDEEGVEDENINEEGVEDTVESNIIFPDFLQLSAAEIYDLLNPTGYKHLKLEAKPRWMTRMVKPSFGTVRNSILKLLVDKQIFGETSKSIFTEWAYKKGDRLNQRTAMKNVSEVGLSLLRTICIQNINFYGTEGVANKTNNINLQARCVLLTNCQEGLQYLTIIYGDTQTRDKVDNEASSSEAGWNHLADIFNSNDYAPQNPCDDDRLNHIDPSKPPEPAWMGSELRQCFDKLKTEYTIKESNWKASGKLAMDADFKRGDDEFYTDFMHGHLIMFFMHVHYRGSPPSFITRELAQHLQSDVGVKSSATKKRKMEKEFSSAELANALKAPVQLVLPPEQIQNYVRQGEVLEQQKRASQFDLLKKKIEIATKDIENFELADDWDSVDDLKQRIKVWRNQMYDL